MGIRRRLNTSSEVIDELGGNKPFAKLVSTRKRPRVDQHISNYRRDGFPPDTFLVVTEALKAIDCEAPPALWGITDPRHAPGLKRAG